MFLFYVLLEVPLDLLLYAFVMVGGRGGDADLIYALKEPYGAGRV